MRLRQEQKASNSPPSYRSIGSFRQQNKEDSNLIIPQPIDSHTDISYQVAAEAAGGVVSTRDFVNLRYWSVIDDVFFSAGVSVTHSAMPPQPKRVRYERCPG